MIHSEIYVVKCVGKQLNSRTEAEQLFVEIEYKMSVISDITLNFSNVEFMSRSFADEFYKLRLNFSSDYNIQVDCKNVNDQTKDILAAVARTQETKLRKVIQPKEVSFGNFSDFNRFVLSM